MGGVAVLHAQDVLADRGHAVIYRDMKPRKSPNPSSGSTKSNRRKKSPEKKNNKNSTINGSTSKNLFMGQVKILKRGEELKIPDGEGNVVESVDLRRSSPSAGRLGPEPEIVAAELKVPVEEKKIAESEYLMLSSTGRLGPEPEMLPKQVGLSDFYAGSAFISSPPPSSLPFPSLFVKKHVLGSIDDASTDLRRLLRLEI